MSLKIERYYPAVVAVLCAFGWYRLDLALPKDGKEFLAAALSVGAVFTGFIATAQAILMALPSDSVMARLRTSGYLGDLVRYISAALAGGIVFCLICLFGFYTMDLEERFKLYYSTAWVASGIFCVLGFHRVTRILMDIMRS